MGAAAHEGVQVFPSDTSGVFAVGVVALAIAGTLFWFANRRDPVTAGNVLEPRRRRVADRRPATSGAHA